MSRYKRANTRYMVRLETEIVRDGQSISAAIVDLSLGGAQVEVEFDPPARLGTRIDVSFHLPTLDKPIKAKAEIRVVQPYSVGIQFVTGFRAKETYALSQFFEKLTPAD